jgi:predicted RND superfamily exporter protein
VSLQRHLATVITQRPAAALSLAAALVVAAGYPAAGVPTDNSLAVWFVEDDPALERYRGFLRTFGNDEAVVVAYRSGRTLEAGLDSAGLELLAEAEAAVSAVEGVESVLSPVPLVRAAGVEDAGPALKALGLAGDSGVAALVARVVPGPDLDARRGPLLDGIRAALDTTLVAAGHDVHLAGTGVLYEGLNRQTEADSAVFLALALLVMAVLLRVVLGSVRAVVLTLTPPLAATVATIGIIGWSGGSMNVVMATLPALILVIGVADGVHILIEWFRVRRIHPPATRSERRRLAGEVIARMATPCLYTSLTTALAFLALMSSRMSVLRELGVYAAVGVLLVWVLVVIGTGAGLAVLDVPAPARAWGHRLGARLSGLGPRLARRRAATIGLFGAATIGLLAGASRVEVDTDTLGLLPADHPVVEDSRWVEAHLGLYTPLEFVVEPARGSVLDPTVLAGVAAWQDATASLPFVGRTLGPTDVFALLDERVPSSVGAADSLVEAYREATGDDLRAYLTADRTAARVTAFVPMGTARDFADAVERLEALGREAMGDAGTITATGYLPLYVRIIDYTVSSALSGLALAFAGVFLALALLLRSGRSVLAAVPPNLFPVAAVFGVMGWAGIPLDIATATVGAIILGIAVDDTVHILHRYREARRGGGADAATEALAGAGPGMVLSSLVLALGLGVLMAAGSMSIVYFGLLITLAVVAALAADLVLLPVLLSERNAP